MDNYEVLKTVWLWVILAVIAVMHIAAIPARKPGKGVLTVVCAVNMLLHFVLFGYMLVNAAKPEELFFVLLISSVTALLTTRRGKKEDKDGI